MHEGCSCCLFASTNKFLVRAAFKPNVKAEYIGVLTCSATDQVNRLMGDMLRFSHFHKRLESRSGTLADNSDMDTLYMVTIVSVTEIPSQMIGEIVDQMRSTERFDIRL